LYGWFVRFQDERDMFGFERERFSMSSSFGVGALADDLKYMHESTALRDDHKAMSRPESATFIIPSTASTQHMSPSQVLQSDRTDRAAFLKQAFR
jgi:hypothetical protein